MKQFVIFLVLVSLSGCVGMTGGHISGAKSGRVVTQRLTEGMTLDEASAILADGGALYPPTVFMKDESGKFAPKDPAQSDGFDMALRGFNGLTEVNQSRVQTIVQQNRGQGFFGFDVFYLYLDVDNRLVARAMDHFN